MRYRTLGRTGFLVSEIGLGTEYLIGKSHDHIISVIRAAITGGINYFDLFYAAPDFRDAMGEAFQPYRDRVFLAAHLGATMLDGQYRKSRTLKHCKTFFEDFLTRYQTDYADVLMLHNCDKQADFDKLFNPKGLLGYALELKAQSMTRYLGFSGHTVSTAMQAVESGMIDVLMFPINMAGNAVSGKKALLKACTAHNVGVVCMKPFAGGKLLQTSRTLRISHYQMGGVSTKLSKDSAITPIQCLAYTLSQIGVSTAVPGCANLEELQAALAYIDASEQDKDYASFISDFDQYASGECVYCNHCLPCPAHIDIGMVMRLLDTAAGGALDTARKEYEMLNPNARACTRCGACEERCPFEVPVRERMVQVVQNLDQRNETYSAR